MSAMIGTADGGERVITSAEERRVIVASSVGTVFEWYDFYLYATLAPFFATLFFPKGNATAALLSAFVTYAAGFLVRPFGALIFGRIGGRRVPPHVRADRLVRAGDARHPAPPAGPRPRRGIRRRRDVRRRARAGPPPRLRDELDPDDGHRRLLPRPRRHRHRPRTDEARRLREL